MRFINQPVKFGWQGDTLYLEVHPMLVNGEGEEATMTLVTEEFVAATGDSDVRVDWELIARVFSAKNGVPVAVGGRPAPAGEFAVNRD